jgi:hypothetical protein
VLTSPEAATTACDGACNVIATESSGVDLGGELGEPVETATGATTSASRPMASLPSPTSSTASSPRRRVAAVRGPGDVTVGGSAPTETNYFERGLYAIYSESADSFTAAGNAIGIAADGSESTPPVVAGIGVCSEESTEPAHISGNRMMLGNEPVGIESNYGLAEITGTRSRADLPGSSPVKKAKAPET